MLYRAGKAALLLVLALGMWLLAWTLDERGVTSTEAVGIVICAW